MSVCKEPERRTAKGSLSTSSLDKVSQGRWVCVILAESLIYLMGSRSNDDLSENQCPVKSPFQFHSKFLWVWYFPPKRMEDAVILGSKPISSSLTKGITATVRFWENCVKIASVCSFSERLGFSTSTTIILKSALVRNVIGGKHSNLIRTPSI